MRLNTQPKLLIATILIPVLAVGGLQLALVPIRHFDPDEFQHLYSAWCISKGMLPYKDYFEHHTPFLHFLLAPCFRFFNVETDPDQATSFIFFTRLDVDFYRCDILAHLHSWQTSQESLGCMAGHFISGHDPDVSGKMPGDPAGCVSHASLACMPLVRDPRHAK